MFKNAIVVCLAIGAIVLSGAFFYRYFQKPCDQPTEYSIGRFDEEFGVSKSQFLENVKQAERIWESSVGRELFIYNPESDFKINLIYDERQLSTMQKQKTESGLESVATVLEKLDAEFRIAKSDYERALDAHEKKSQEFEQEQARYESEVDYWNSRGGAPKSQYELLEEKSRQLKTQAAVLNRETADLNAKAKDLNNMLDRRNEAARNYNAVASNYNQTFGHGLEFNQAEYTGSAINVYQFKNNEDLLTALAHELGHALGMDHVENPSSIMYYLTGTNVKPGLVPSVEDLSELKRVCE
ncbi:MAG TPA: matrixin family metalloprotease [Candidatus Paceibacterota bacterium]